MKKLTKLSDYLDQLYNLYLNDPNYCASECLNDIVRINKFIKQKPTLGMFIATDKEGNLLEEPDKMSNSSFTDEKHYHNGQTETFYNEDFYEEYVKEYQEALDRVVFKGFEVDYKKGLVGGTYSLVKEDVIIAWSIKGINGINDYLSKLTLEDLTQYNLELTKEV